jgi:hypothetical protein
MSVLVNVRASLVARIAEEEMSRPAAEIPQESRRRWCGRCAYFVADSRLLQERRDARAAPPHRDPGGTVMDYEYFATHDYDDN